MQKLQNVGLARGLWKEQGEGGVAILFSLPSYQITLHNTGQMEVEVESMGKTSIRNIKESKNLSHPPYPPTGTIRDLPGCFLLLLLLSGSSRQTGKGG